MLTKLSTLLQNLPRESRDTLFLLLVIAWVLLPQTPNLPIWCSVLASGVLLAALIPAPTPERADASGV